MRSLSDTLERLARFRKDKSGHAATGRSKLSRLQRFGSNPGALQAWYHVPVGLTESPALVVVLHGCTQNAAGYDHASGWSKIAEDFGFAVLYPEQVPANNPNVCFNWFTPSDIRRGEGEVHSIRQMVETIIVEYGIDRRRVYITGLSAGGAMANAALCAYPEIFTGGAIIAGLPFAAATTVPEAFDRMRGHGIPDVESLRSRLSGASPHAGPWPTISVWHGTMTGPLRRRTPKRSSLNGAASMVSHRTLRRSKRSTGTKGWPGETDPVGTRSSSTSSKVWAMGHHSRSHLATDTQHHICWTWEFPLPCTLPAHGALRRCPAASRKKLVP